MVRFHVIFIGFLVLVILAPYVKACLYSQTPPPPPPQDQRQSRWKRETTALVYDLSSDVLTVNIRSRRDASNTPSSQITLFTELDEDSDGQIKLEEWVAATGTMENFWEFLWAKDGNEDGQMSLEELQTISKLKFEPRQ
ncbi:uncharacterized protein [Amphiura filiformis]|uniref:uncharacterized protein n=1 Tax=Amphiura filiformis TaxID=82378 RepID=UPI003B211FA6